MNDASIDQLLTELSRLHSNGLRLGDEDSRRGELIQLLLEKVRQEYTESRLRALTRDEMQREIQRLEHVQEMIEHRMKAIRQLLGKMKNTN